MRVEGFNTIHLFLMEIALNPGFYSRRIIVRYMLPCTGERSREGLKKGDTIRKDQDGERDPSVQLILTVVHQTRNTASQSVKAGRDVIDSRVCA